MNDNRQALRDAVQARHAKLDALIYESSPVSSLENYATFLRCFLALQSRFECSVISLEKEFGWSGREHRFIDLIGDDLDALGHPFSAHEIKPVQKSELSDSRWGHAYALEGSALGGSFLLQQITAARLVVPIRFLTQLTIDAESRWPAFVSALNREKIEMSLAVAGAYEVFDTAWNWISAEMERE